MTDGPSISLSFDHKLPKINCPKHGIHTYVIQSTIKGYEGYWYTVEDTHLDVGCPGCTISIWGDGERDHHICMDKEEALAIADAIYKLFKN